MIFVYLTQYKLSGTMLNLIGRSSLHTVSVTYKDLVIQGFWLRNLQREQTFMVKGRGYSKNPIPILYRILCYSTNQLQKPYIYI